jgi:hypothetical protein
MDQPARCIRHMNASPVLSGVTGRKVNNYVRKHCPEYYLVPPGFVFRGIAIQLKAPMLVGLVPESCTILLPFTKPCYGTMLYEIAADDDDFSCIRSALGTVQMKKGKRNRRAA